MTHNPRQDRDRGLTLIELLVAIGVIAAIATVLSATVVVTLRQNESTQARVDVARWEQAIALWMPADLTSASTIDDDPGLAPTGCSLAVCSSASNVIQLGWGDTTVSYRYGPSDTGTSYEMTRVECDSSGCNSLVVLRDLAPPPPTTPPWTALDDEVPADIIDVTDPIVVGSGDPSDTDPISSAQRVIVSVNGVPGVDGIDRSSRISFTAGGVTRSTLDPPTFEGPTFLDAQSSCGGPVTLIVDESGSIGTADTAVESAVEGFIDEFTGTPTRLQIIEFSSRSRVVGATGTDWNHYYDLTESSDVTAVKAALDVDSGGWTNWEDALYRTFYYRDGQTYAELGSPAAPTPELVVFFTDGQPTRDRVNEQSDTAALSPPVVPATFDHTGNLWWGGGSMSPRAWFRADDVVEQVRGNPNIRMIGVGIGTSFGSSTTVEFTGWPWTGIWYDSIPNEVFLGDLVSGGDPSQYGTGASGNYVKREYSVGSWGDVSNADLLVSSDLGNLASALSEIALSECGGTLTVQTRTSSGDLAPIDATYRIGAEQSSTSPVRKAAVFDVSVGGASADVQLIPQIDTPGWSATGWSCTSKGVDLGSDYSDIGADPIEGINVTVAANGAVSCTMTVVSS